jgi:hypothetical protein
VAKFQEVTTNDGPGVAVRNGSHADLASNNIDGNALDAVVVAENSDVQLGGAPGVLNAPDETAVPNGGFGLRCASNASASGGLNTLTGVQGDRKFDSSCSNGPKIK